MARDAIGLHGISLEDEQLPIPEASAIEKIDPSKGTFAEDGKGTLYQWLTLIFLNTAVRWIIRRYAEM